MPPIQLGVFEDNARGSRVYEKVGFRLGPALRAEVFDGRTEVYMVAETGL